MIAAETEKAAVSPGLGLLGQIFSIADEIRERKNELSNYGLLGGKPGVILLFAYLASIFPNKNYSETLHEWLEDLNEVLSSQELPYSMTGVAGIGFVFQHLRNIGVLDNKEDINLSELDTFIAEGVEHDFRQGNWDPLHGMVALGIYFLERNKETGEKEYLERIIECLAGMRTDGGGYRLWITPGYEKYSNDNYNFGIAHGMPGLLSFLAQAYERDISPLLVKELIGDCIPYLLENEFKNNLYYSFPSSIDVSPSTRKDAIFSRLAWCYGDLCMANMLIHCGRALGREDWQRKGIDIAVKTTHRSFEDSGVVDAPFCHGSTGLVHQYHRLCQLTQMNVFREAASNWLRLTLDHFYKPGEGAAGYYFRTINQQEERFELQSNYSLLEGSAGIALVYLSYLFEIKPDWDIIFLCNV